MSALDQSARVRFWAQWAKGVAGLSVQNTSVKVVRGMPDLLHKGGSDSGHYQES